MSYDGYVRFCRNATDDQLAKLLKEHTHNILNAPNGYSEEAWTRMQRIVKAEMQRRLEFHESVVTEIRRQHEILVTP